MSIHKSGINQRKSFRFAVPEDRQQCMLHVGDAALPGRLLDESADGFSVLVATTPKLAVNGTAELTTSSGRFVVRVRHVSEVAAAALTALEIPCESAAEDEHWCRLGLLRVSDVMIGRPRSTGIADAFRSGTRSVCVPNGARSLSSLLIVGAGFAVLLTLGGMLWYAKDSGGRGPEPIAAASSAWRSPIESPEGFDPPAAPSRSTTIDGATRSIAKAGEAVANTLGRLPGAGALLLPDVAKKLQLTKLQLSEIEKIEKRVEKSLRQIVLDGLSGSERETAMQDRDELLSQAHDDAMKVLTPQQQAQWDKLAPSGEKR
jgi:hypothetical protein